MKKELKNAKLLLVSLHPTSRSLRLFSAPFGAVRTPQTLTSAVPALQATASHAAAALPGYRVHATLPNEVQELQGLWARAEEAGRRVGASPPWSEDSRLKEFALTLRGEAA